MIHLRADSDKSEKGQAGKPSGGIWSERFSGGSCSHSEAEGSVVCVHGEG